MKHFFTKLFITAVVATSLLATPCSVINTITYEQISMDNQYYPLENNIELPHPRGDFFDD